MEIWKPVKDFEDYYEISNLGRLKSLGRSDNCKRYHPSHIYSITNKNGWYLAIILRSPTMKKSIKIHRLVYETFVGKIPNGFEIHHIDGNKQNNNLLNLELIDKSEHHRLHSQSPNAFKAMNDYNKFIRPKKILQLTLDGEVLNTFNNAKEASRSTGVCSRNILQVANKTEYSVGRVRKQAGGYKWRYL